MSEREVVIKPFEQQRAEAFAAASAKAGDLKMDEAPAGGRYLVGDQVVDANGQPVKDEPKADAKKGDR